MLNVEVRIRGVMGGRRGRRKPDVSQAVDAPIFTTNWISELIPFAAHRIIARRTVAFRSQTGQ